MGIGEVNGVLKFLLGSRDSSFRFAALGMTIFNDIARGDAFTSTSLSTSLQVNKARSALLSKNLQKCHADQREESSEP